MAHGPDIGGVVGARGGGHVGFAEQPFLDREQLVHVGGHQHDVHQALMHDLTDNVEKLWEIAIAILLARPDLGREARGSLAAQREIGARTRSPHAKGHVRVLCVRDDERAGGRIGFDLR